MFGVTLLGLGPLLYCVLYYCTDVWRYLTYDETESAELDIVSWQVGGALLSIILTPILILLLNFTHCCLHHVRAILVCADYHNPIMILSINGLQPL